MRFAPLVALATGTLARSPGLLAALAVVPEGKEPLGAVAGGTVRHLAAVGGRLKVYL